MYDLLLKGGTVVDPAQGIHRVLDVAIEAGKIARLKEGIPEDEAQEVVDVTDKIVTPGLIDLHTHAYWGGTALGIKADLVGRETGVTTFVDAGSAGAGNFVGFKEHVIDRSKVRILAFLHISYLGLLGAVYDPANFVIVGESFDLRYAMLRPAIEVAEAFPDLIKGIKVRTSVESSGDQGVKPLRLARQAAEALGKPVMVHVGPPPPSRREVLSLLREGDILSHAFRGEPNSPLDRHGRILPEMLEARERGVIMDLGHGGSSFSWNVADKMLEQGFLPDVISSDIHIGLRVKTGGWPGMPPRDQPTTMSKMLSLGMNLDDVIRASTVTPASVIGCADELGSLRRGSVADVTVLELEEGQFEFNDVYSGVTVGSKKLTPLATIVEGEVLSNKVASP
jgi:dihydroorotase